MPGARIEGYVEREAFASSILLARMEDKALEPAPVWCGLLEDFRSREWRGTVDCITAGFPCQPWSTAGKRGGESDDRWIWPDIVRVIEDIQPACVFLENVPGLIAGRGLNSVLGSLAAIGFDAEWCSISAADVGASHLRKRVFILAFDARRGRGILREPSERSFGLTDGCDEEVGVTGREYGELQQRVRRLPESAGAGGDLADHERDRWQGERGEGPEARATRRSDGADIFAPGPNDLRWRDIISERAYLSPAIVAGSIRVWWNDPTQSLVAETAESSVRCVAYGDALVLDEHRTDQLRAIGNGVVALQAAVAFRILAARVTA